MKNTRRRRRGGRSQGKPETKTPADGVSRRECNANIRETRHAGIRLKKKHSLAASRAASACGGAKVTPSL